MFHRADASTVVFSALLLAVLGATPSSASPAGGSKLPVCNAGAPQTVECSGAVTAVGLDGTASSNPVPGPLIFNWEPCKHTNVSIDDATSPTPTLYVDLAGACEETCQVFLAVRNRFGSSVCSTTTVVRDTTAPSIACPASITIPVGGSTDPSVTGFATATDVCNAGPAVSYSDDLSQGPNTIVRTWVADDGCQSSQCQQTITIESPPPTGPHLDIKPGSCPNPINVNTPNPEVINVPISLLGNDFDITQVDIGSLAIERELFMPGTGGVPPYQTNTSDTATPYLPGPCGCHALAGDGLPDISMHFDRVQLVDVLGLDLEPDGAVIELKLTGRLLNGTPFSAKDCVVIINNGN